MLKVMLFFSNLCVQVLNCFVHSIAEYHWVQTCFITTTTTSSRNLQKSREITAVLQKVSILEVESLSAFCAWHFCIRKKQTFISRLIKQSMFKSDELLLSTFNLPFIILSCKQFQHIFISFPYFKLYKFNLYSVIINLNKVNYLNVTAKLIVC